MGGRGREEKKRKRRRKVVSFWELACEEISEFTLVWYLFTSKNANCCLNVSETNYFVAIRKKTVDVTCGSFFFWLDRKPVKGNCMCSDMDRFWAVWRQPEVWCCFVLKLDSSHCIDWALGKPLIQIWICIENISNASQKA